MKFTSIICLLTLLWGHLLNGQDSTATLLNNQYHNNLLTTMYQDAIEFYTPPSEFTLSDGLILGGGIAGITAGFLFLDKEFNTFFNKERTSTSSDISSVFEKFGNGAYPLTLMAGLYGYSWYNKDHTLRVAAFSAIEAIAVSSLAVLLTKSLVSRRRPFKSSDPHDVLGPIHFEHYNHSFISGHTTTAFAFASSISAVYSDHIWLGIGLYTGAALAGISRIHDNKHWFSDVLAGAIVGTLCGRFIAKKNLSRLSHFSVNTNGQALSLSYRF